MLIKEQVEETLLTMPDEFEIDDIVDKLILLDNIQQGLTDSKDGKVFSEEEAINRLEKMAKIIWTSKALNDLDDIGKYIARESIRYAVDTIRKLFHSTEILKSLPKTGRVVPELNKDNIRELIKGNYRIIYLINIESNIEILTVHHSSRNFETILL